MATALVTAEDVNVVIVDWRGGSLPLYSQAAANTRLVGMEVARMVEVSVSENKKMSNNKTKYFERERKLSPETEKI